MSRILLVEDDEAVRAFVKRALEMDSHRVEAAENGALGLAAFAEEGAGFDLVLTDIQMPVMDGIELSQALVLAKPEQKILMMTGYAHQRERVGELNGIVLGVVQKPFTLPEIRKEVAAALAA